jgi:hypothetical protein
MPTQAEKDAAGTASEQLTRANLINTACSGWVSRLIDLSRRNNLLFYRPVQGGTIEVPSYRAALTMLLRGESVFAQDLLADPVDRPARVLQIARKAMENLEEKVSRLFTSFLTSRRGQQMTAVATSSRQSSCSPFHSR